MPRVAQNESAFSGSFFVFMLIIFEEQVPLYIAFKMFF